MGHSLFDDDDDFFNSKEGEFHENNIHLFDHNNDRSFNVEHTWESDDGFGTMELVMTIAAVIGIIIVLALLCKCCQRRRNRGQILTLPPTTTTTVVSVPAPYPQQQYAPAPAPAPYPAAAPYPVAPYPVSATPGFPYPVQMPQPMTSTHLAAPTAPDINALPPSYEQATGVGEKNPPYNPYPH